MEDLYRFALERLGDSLHDRMPLCEDGADVASYLALAERQQMVPLLLDGLMRCPHMAASPETAPMIELAAVSMAHNALLSEVAERFSLALEAAGVDHMPLKGLVLRDMYPYPEWRMMGDADILVRREDIPRAVALARRLGYGIGRESDHEYHLRTPEGIHVELHKSPVPTYERDLYAYFGDGWMRAVTMEGWEHRFRMTDEDLYVYLLAHFAKHYRSGGAGVRYAVDLYVLARHTKDFDHLYAEREMEGLGLSMFHGNIRRMLGAWFDGDAWDDVSAYLTDRLFSGSVYGDHIRETCASAARLTEGTHAVGARWRQVLFPSYETLCRREGKQLDRRMLPLYWCARWGQVLGRRRDRFKRKTDDLKTVTRESLEAYREEMERVGL